MYVHSPSTQHVYTQGEWCVSMCVCMNRGMKVNTSVRALKTRPSVSTCVCMSPCLRVVGALTALLVSLLQGPHKAQGGHLPPESCMLTRPGGEALACCLQDNESTSVVLKVFLIEALMERYLFIKASLASLGHQQRVGGMWGWCPNFLYP